jgi:hypothetical protein
MDSFLYCLTEHVNLYMLLLFCKVMTCTVLLECRLLNDILY